MDHLSYEVYCHNCYILHPPKWCSLQEVSTFRHKTWRAPPFIIWFTLYSEVLSNILNKAEVAGEISRVPLAWGNIHIYHLFFVDDKLFCKATSLEWRRLLRLIETYKQTFGQRLKRKKSPTCLAGILFAYFLLSFCCWFCFL